MKEKIIFTLSFAGFIGIMWLSSTTKTYNVKPVISEELTVPPQENNIRDYIDEVAPETTFVNDGKHNVNIAEVEDCSLTPHETDVFTFGNAFQYYRQCLGSDSGFQWKGHNYTTLLSEEVIIEFADSVKVENEPHTNNEVSEIR